MRHPAPPPSLREEQRDGPVTYRFQPFTYRYLPLQVSVTVPITRPDVMHACDVMEDVAVSYSYAKIPRSPAPVMCTGKQQPLSKLTDLMRLELAQVPIAPCLAPPATRACARPKYGNRATHVYVVLPIFATPVPRPGDAPLAGRLHGGHDLRAVLAR